MDGVVEVEFDLPNPSMSLVELVSAAGRPGGCVLARVESTSLA